MTIYNLNIKGFNCKRCSDGISYPSKFMFNMLKQIKIDFETEYSPEWIEGRKYDFYVPSINKIIEMDGWFHNNDNNMNGISKEESKAIDDYKDDKAKLHDIEVIRIDCDYGNVENRFEYIKENIINSKRLNKLFDLRKIDWIKIEEYCEKSIVKTVCEYWKEHNNINNEELTSSDLCKFFKLGRCCIVNYLKKGTKLNWCNYNFIDEYSNGGKRSGKISNKSIEVFKNGISLGVFVSSRDLERQSEKLFGVRFLEPLMCKVCNGKQSHHKGFTFQYVN